MPQRKEPSFTGSIIHHKPSWTAWRCWRIAIAWQRFIAICGVKEETVCEWLQRAALHVEEIEVVLLANYPVSRAQLDAPLDLRRSQGRKRSSMSSLEFPVKAKMG
jgi:hypothetical protein